MSDETSAGSPASHRLTADEVHDLDQVRKAIGELTPEDLARLSIAAKSILGGFRIEPKRGNHRDLLSEAVTRTLSGERQWRKRVALERHLFRVMRSIASHWRREALREKLSPVFESLEDHLDWPDPRPNPEATVILRETVEAIYRHFADDAAALAVLDCMSHGMKGPWIRASTGLTQPQVNATIKRIRRYARRGEYDDD